MIRDQKPELLEPKAMRIFSSKKGRALFQVWNTSFSGVVTPFFQKKHVRFPLRDHSMGPSFLGGHQFFLLQHICIRQHFGRIFAQQKSWMKFGGGGGVILLMAEILHQLIGSLSGYLQGLYIPVVQDFFHQQYE